MNDINIQIRTEISKLLAKAKADKIDLSELLPALAERFHSSIEANSLEHGRWNGNLSEIGLFSGGNQRWQPLAESTKRGYKRKGISNLERTLARNAGGLQSSNNARPSGKNAILFSNNKVYAAIQNFGGDIVIPAHQRDIKFKTTKTGGATKVRFAKKKAEGKNIHTKKDVSYSAHTIHIPASPFMLLQQDDLEWCRQKIADFMMGKFAD
jgi:phage gpG-like protein